LTGAIQIIRDTLGGGGGGGTAQCHQMTQGGGRGFAKVSRDIFSKNFEPYSSILACFKRFLGHYFWKNFNVTSHRGGGGGGTDQCHKMTQGGGGGGSKITQKSVTYYLNGPYLTRAVP
jgi:hypothetical protein